VTGGDEIVLSARHACPSCGYSLSEISPRLFSFNSPHGACPTCSGLGFLREVDPEKLVVDPDAVPGRGLPGHRRPARLVVGRQLEQLGGALGFDLHTPWRRLPPEVRELILAGSSEEHEFVWQGSKGAYRFRDRFEGRGAAARAALPRDLSEQIRRELERYMSFAPCHTCRGARLRPEALAVKVAGEPGRGLGAVGASGAGVVRELELGEREREDRRQGPARGRRPARLPGRRWGSTI
jgi:excinuclease ABC subunit A